MAARRHARHSYQHHETAQRTVCVLACLLCSQAIGAQNSNAARDFLQSVKRFYKNTFTDLQKQHIMDGTDRRSKQWPRHPQPVLTPRVRSTAGAVFLGVFTPAPDAHHIWELDSDLHLHNRPPPHLLQPLYPPAFAEGDAAAAEPPAAPVAAAPSADAAGGGGAANGVVGAADGDTAGAASGAAAAAAVSRGARRGGSASGDMFDTFYAPSTMTSFEAPKALAVPEE